MHAPPEVTWRGARDLLTVRTPLVDAAFWVRTLPDRIVQRPIPAPPVLTFGSDGSDGGAGVGLLSYVRRTATTDSCSRRSFGHY